MTFSFFFWAGLKMFEGKAPFFAKLVDRVEHGARAVLVSLQVIGRKTQLALQTGDHIAVFPKNHPDLVKRLINKVSEVTEENRILKQRGQM